MRKLLRESLLLLKMELSGLKYQKILNPKALILEQTLGMRMKIGYSMTKILIQKRKKNLFLPNVKEKVLILFVQYRRLLIVMRS